VTDKLAKAIAMNKYKNGQLHTLEMSSCIKDYPMYEKFFGGFRVSEKDHEEWYGDSKVAKEMKNDQLE
jgi:hypothetical protein